MRAGLGGDFGSGAAGLSELRSFFVDGADWGLDFVETGDCFVAEACCCGVEAASERVVSPGRGKQCDKSTLTRSGMREFV